MNENETQIDQANSEVNVDRLVIKPKPGDKIYVHSSFYISHGQDDFRGGLCTIKQIEYSDHLPPEHFNYCMITIEERPGWSYNYRHLLDEQEKLKKEFGDAKGHCDPDINTPWIEDGDIVNGEVYHGNPIW